MPSKNKRRVRRSLSITAEAYWRLRELAQLGQIGESCSQVVEQLINRAADEAGIPTVTREEAIAAFGMDRKPEPAPKIASQHFTF